MKELAVRSDAVIAALDIALKGSPDKLYSELMKASGLPGPRANDALANAFADECARRGAVTDRMTLAMASLDPDYAKGGTAAEYLPMCGVLAQGARGVSDPKVRERSIQLMHDACDDLRFRVRDAVTMSLERLGAVMGDALVARAESFMDGFFHAACVLFALSRPAWLNETHDASAVVARLHDAAELVRNATRSSMRYPGYKALLDALRLAPTPLALRHGVSVLEEVERWTTLGNVDLREIAVAAVRGDKLRARFGDQIAAIEKGRAAAIPAPRDGKKVDLPTRKRGRR